MLEWLNEGVHVEVRMRRDNTVIPIAFLWRGQRFEITSWGREGSETQDGRTARGYLVQTPGGDSWELCQDVETAQWTLTRHWAGRYRHSAAKYRAI